MGFTYCSHPTLPHFCKLRGGGVDQARVLGPSGTLPLWHGQHCHGGGQQGERATLKDGQPGKRDGRASSVQPVAEADSLIYNDKCNTMHVLWKGC